MRTRSRVVAYLAHPLGPKNGEELRARQDNIADCLKWLELLVSSTKWVIECSWFAYVMALEDEAFRPRTLVDQSEQIHRCDIYIATSWLSPHIKLEIPKAKRAGLVILDLTWVGKHLPKELTEEQLRRLHSELESVDQVIALS